MKSACLLALFCALSAPLIGLAARVGPAAALDPVPGEVIVGFKSDAGTLRKYVLAARAAPAAVAVTLGERSSTLGARVGRQLLAGAAVGAQAQVVRAVGVDAFTLARELAADPEVAYAVPNGRRRALVAPNDPLYAAAAAGVRSSGPDSGQWYLRAPDNTIRSALNIEAAWARTLGSSSVVVAVLDTGVRFEHPDLGLAANGGRLLAGYDMVSETAVANDGGGRDGDPSDPGDWTTAAENSNRSGRFWQCDPAGNGSAVASASSWHGTATASLIGAATNNGIGMAGAAPGVQVLPVRVLGKCFGTDADIQAGMLWAAGISVPGVPDNANPARVINMSLGSVGRCDPGYQSVVDQIVARGVTIVAAGGNGAGGAVGVPGRCRGVLAVLALRHIGSKVGFSDLGPEIAIAAPGGNCINIAPGTPCLYPILAATNTGSQGPVNSTWSDSFRITVGTSFASPLVAAVVGLMVSQQPGLTPAGVRNALQSTARAFPNSGADNGPSDPTVVAQCRVPMTGVEQLQCYCTTALCGAGMLDAGAAVAAVSGPVARIDVTPGSPTAGASVNLSASSSTAAGAAAIVTFSWSLTAGGGIVSGFTTATNAGTAALTPSGAGAFTVQLTVTDSLGQSNSTSSTVQVAAAPAPPAPPVVAPPTSSGGGGGGAFSWAWVLGVLLAAGLLWRLPVDQDLA